MPTDRPTHAGPIRRFLNGTMVGQARVDEVNQIQHDRDERGYRVHLALGLLFCALLAGPVSVVEFAGLPVGVMWLLRIWCVGLPTLAAMAQPVFLSVVFWMAWQVVTLLWSPDPAQGLAELGTMRWIWIFVVLYPILDRRRWLIIAVACGYLVANGVQAIHAIGAQVGWEAVTFGRMPDRFSGWWQPVVGGTMLCGALGLHLPAALMGRGRTQILGAAGAIVTLLGIIATGSRGPWLAAAGLIAIALAVAVCAIRSRRRRLGTIAAGAVIGALAVAIGWATVGGAIERRTERAYEEITRAIEDKRFDTDTGGRLLMWWWSLEAMAERPITGIGSGGYHAWVDEHLREQGIDPDDRRVHDHAHSTPLHIGATSGIVGLALSALILALAIRGSMVGLDRETLGTYDAGPAFAIVGLMLAGLFDPVHVNAQTSALLFTLLALCNYTRPTPATRGGAGA